MTDDRMRPALRTLPLGDVRPKGWLARQLRLQADGLTGHLEEVWPDVGPESGWLGGTGESWERGPYYLDGLVPLAYLLDDEALIAKAGRWIEWMLNSQRPDGQFGPDNSDWWPRMVAAKVLIQYVEATGDDRVVPFLRRYFAYQHATLARQPLADWAQARSAENVLPVLWLHERIDEDWLLDLARTLLRQGCDWGAYLGEGHVVTGRANTFSHLTHGPNVAMGLKHAAVKALMGLQPDAPELTRSALGHLDRWHGQVHGMFSGDEWLGGREATAGVETCQIVEYLYTLSWLAQVFGDGYYGDLLEQVGYNLLGAACDPRMVSHQYHQQANQVAASIAQRPWTFSSDDANIFGLEPHFGCCTANYHQGWPKLVASLWQTADRDLVAVAYGPCEARLQLPDGAFAVAEETDYPFSGLIRLRILEAPTDPAGLRLRVPGWAHGSIRVTVDGCEKVLAGDESGFVRLEQTWSAGDVVEIHLPFEARRVRRERQAVGVRVGPLVMVHSPGERWRPIEDARGLGEWEVFPRGSWNVGLWVDGDIPLEEWAVTEQGVAEVPFDPAHPPLTLAAQANTVKSWTTDGANAAVVPEGPVPVMWAHTLPLVPYGSARIRVAEFPTILPVQARSLPWEVETHS